MFCCSTHINETGVMVVESNKNYKKKKVYNTLMHCFGATLY